MQNNSGLHQVSIPTYYIGLAVFNTETTTGCWLLQQDSYCPS